jgi:hypothetical protein
MQHILASGSFDQSVIIWSSQSFELLRRIQLLHPIHTLAFGASDVLCVGVLFQGVYLCNALTGEVGVRAVPTTGYSIGLAVCMTCGLFTLLLSLISLSPLQYLRACPGLPPHTLCGPCLHSRLSTWPQR